jgi:hypothetical protein
MPQYEIRIGVGGHTRIVQTVQLNDSDALRFTQELLERMDEEPHVEVWRDMCCVLQIGGRDMACK